MSTQIPNTNDRFTPDSQKRLLAYTTAAGLGAFFAGQNAEAARTLSLALGPYPTPWYQDWDRRLTTIISTSMWMGMGRRISTWV